MLARDHGDHTHEWDDEVTPEGVPVTLAEMSGNDVAHLIEDIDGYLCELGTAQIRDGLHVLGAMPALPDTLRALTRLPNGQVPGLQASLAAAVRPRPRGPARPRRAPGSIGERDVAGSELPDACRRDRATRRCWRAICFLDLEAVGFQERVGGRGGRCVSGAASGRWSRAAALRLPDAGAGASSR